MTANTSHGYASQKLAPRQASSSIDPWATGELFARIEHPHPSIAFAAIGPIDPWHATRPKEMLVRCLLIGSDGMTVRAVLERRGEQSIHDFWTRLAVQLELQQKQGVFTFDVHRMHQPSMLSFAQCRTLANWISSNGDPFPSYLRRRFLDDALTGFETNEFQEIQLVFAQANQELQQAIDSAITSLDDELSQALILRPNLRFESATTLLRYARSYGPKARAFMCQALRTECLGLLNAAAEEVYAGKPPGLADVVCRGERLPKALIAYGVPQWLHRLTLTNKALNSEDCDGRPWLAAVKTIAQQRKGLDSETECEQVTLNVRFVQKHVGGCTAAVETLLRQTLHCLGRTESLRSRYEAACTGICKRITKATGRSAERIDVMRWLISLPINHVLDRPMPELLADAASYFLRLPMHEAFHAVFREQPQIPETFRPRGRYTVVRLEDLDTILSVGRRFANCLGALTTIMDYVHFGFMFYAIKEKGRVLAVFTLEAEPDHSDSKLQVKVQQLEAGASKDHCEAVMHRDAWELAVCLSTPESTEAIRRYLAATKLIRDRFD